MNKFTNTIHFPTKKTIRISRPELFCKKRRPSKFCKIHRKTPVQSLFQIKLQTLRPANLLKKRLRSTFKSTFFIENHWWQLLPVFRNTLSLYCLFSIIDWVYLFYYFSCDMFVLCQDISSHNSKYCILCINKTNAVKFCNTVNYWNGKTTNRVSIVFPQLPFSLLSFA